MGTSDCPKAEAEEKEEEGNKMEQRYGAHEDDLKCH